MEPYRTKCGCMARNKTNRRPCNRRLLAMICVLKSLKCWRRPGLAPRFLSWICPTNKTGQARNLPGVVFLVAPSFRRSTSLQK